MAVADPIREIFNAAEKADKAGDVLFYVAALLSFASLLVEPASPWYRFVMVGFAVVVVLYFSAAVVVRMYFLPRAEQKRRQDFLGHALGVSLTPENTEGYYNTVLNEGPKKVAVQLLENTFFTKELMQRVAHRQRATVVVYVIAWIAIVALRETDFGIILAVTQFVFSEQIISKWIRIEWLRSTAERVHGSTYRLLQSGISAKQLLPHALDDFVAYETAKATAGVVIPSKLFDELNNQLSASWDNIRSRLNV